MISRTQNFVYSMAQHRKQRGLAVVESVIVLPLVLFIMLAVAEFGNAILQYNSLTQSVRDGAKFVAVAARRGSSGSVNLTAEDISETSNIVAYGTIAAGTPLLPGLSPADVTVPDLGNGNVSVTANYGYQPFFLGGVPNLVGGGNPGGAFTLSAEVVMRVLF